MWSCLAISGLGGIVDDLAWLAVAWNAWKTSMIMVETFLIPNCEVLDEIPAAVDVGTKAPGGISCEREWHHPHRKAHGPLPGEVLSLCQAMLNTFYCIVKPHFWVWVNIRYIGSQQNGLWWLLQRPALICAQCDPQVHLADLALQLEGGRSERGNRKGLSQAQRRGNGRLMATNWGSFSLKGRQNPKWTIRGRKKNRLSTINYSSFE